MLATLVGPLPGEFKPLAMAVRHRNLSRAKPVKVTPPGLRFLAAQPIQHSVRNPAYAVTVPGFGGCLGPGQQGGPSHDSWGFFFSPFWRSNPRQSMARPPPGGLGLGNGTLNFW